MAADDPHAALCPEVAAAVAAPVDPATGSKAFVLEKRTYGAVDAAFTALVAEHGWRTAVLVGFSTHACVMKTAWDIFDSPLPLRPVVYAPLCESHSGGFHASAVALMRNLLGTVPESRAELAAALAQQ